MPFAPTDITGLWGWWKSDILPYTELDQIDNWDDSSGNNRDLTWPVAGTGLTPTYRWAWTSPTRTQNGLPSADFDGVFDRLWRGFGMALPAGSNGSIFAVAAFDALNGVGTICSSADESSSTRWLNFRPTSTGHIGFEQRNGGVFDHVRGDTALSTGQWYILEVHSDSSAYSLYVQDVAQTITVISGANTGDWFADTAGRDNFMVGAMTRTGTSQFLDGLIGELIIYDGVTLTADNRADVYEYLWYKWFVPPGFWGWADEWKATDEGWAVL